MAIYHFSVAVLKRSEDKSAVAAAAWRANQTLRNERLGRKTYFPKTQAKTLAYEGVLLPSGTSPIYEDRSTLWNTVEAREVRNDAQLARIINVALPLEISEAESNALPIRFAQERLLPLGLPVDVTISVRPDPDGRGFLRHAFLMFPTRVFGADGPTTKHRPADSRAELRAWRAAWADLVHA